MSSFTLSVELGELREAASRFASSVLAPAARDHERAGDWPGSVRDVLDGFALAALDLPTELGGAGSDGGSLAKVVLLEALAGGDAGGLPAADQPGPAAGAVAACPDRVLAERVAGSCLAGEASTALALADPDTGGPGAVEWAPAWPPLGSVWVSDGDELRLLSIGADASRPAAEALAFHASGGISVDLGDATEAGRWSLPPGAGLRIRGRARLWAAAVAVGVAQAAFDATIAYTTERVVFGKPVAHHQGNAFDLAGLATNLHGARLAVRDAAGNYDHGDPHAGFWATQAWLFAVDTAVAVTDAGIQLLGGHGFLVDHLAEKRFREARMLGLLWGGRDGAQSDVAGAVLDVPDPLFGS